MLKKINLLSYLCLVVLIFCLVPLCFTAQESITITTYYPAPYGNYRTLYTDGLAVGSGYRNQTIPNGTLIVYENIGVGVPVPLSANPLPGAISVLSPAGGQIQWGAASYSNMLTSDQGGGFELGALDGGTNPVIGGRPYLDFHYGNGLAENFNARIINSADKNFLLDSPGAGTLNVTIDGNLNVTDLYTTNLYVSGSNKACKWISYAINSGTQRCDAVAGPGYKITTGPIYGWNPGGSIFPSNGYFMCCKD